MSAEESSNEGGATDNEDILPLPKKRARRVSPEKTWSVHRVFIKIPSFMYFYAFLILRTCINYGHFHSSRRHPWLLCCSDEETLNSCRTAFSVHCTYETSAPLVLSLLLICFKL